MSFENWWETPIVKEEMKPEPPVNEPVEEGWGVFLAKKADQLGISFPINMLAERSIKRMEPILKDPWVKQWIDIQSEVLKKEVENFFKQPGRGKAVVSFATAKDLARYEGNGNTGVLDVSGEQGAMPMNKIDKNLVFEYQSGKVRLSILADTKSILRVAVLFLITFAKEPWRNSIALVPMKPPADDELLKIVGAIENGMIVEEGVISKVKSFLGFKKKEAKELVKPKKDIKTTANIAFNAAKKVLAQDEFKVLKKYIKWNNKSDWFYDPVDEDDQITCADLGDLEFKYDLPGSISDQDEAFFDLWYKYIAEVHKIIDDEAYEFNFEGKPKDAEIELTFSSKADITKEAYYGELLARLGEKEAEPVTEATNIAPEPATEGWGVKTANKIETTGWMTALLGCIATIMSAGFALKFKAIWAMIIGGYAVDKIGGGIKKLLCKKGNKYLEKALANPEMAAYIRAKAKDVVADIKKQTASMKDSKYEISTKAEDIDAFEDSVFNQGYSAPGEDTDERIKFDHNSYFYTEKKLGEYTIVVLYDTNSIKGVYVVVSIKDTKDKFGSAWLRARPIPAPTSEELKKMGFKG